MGIRARVKGSISSILVGDKLVKVSLSLYDTDGLEGLYVPESQFRETSKDVASSAMSGNLSMNTGGYGNNLAQWGMQAVQNAYQKTSNAISKAIKKNKGNPDFRLGAFVASIPGFLKSKLFLGIVIMVAAYFILENVGFIVTALFVLFFYGLLLGEKNVVRLLIASVCITLVLYIVFSGMLSVDLPRGTIGFLRNFALWLESVVAAVKNIF